MSMSWFSENIVAAVVHIHLDRANVVERPTISISLIHNKLVLVKPQSSRNTAVKHSKRGTFIN